jgi:hypothetical protein
MQDPNDKSSIDKIYQDIKDLFTVNSETFVAEFDKIAVAGNKIQTVFTQGRQRVVELRNAIADAAPDVIRLGGNVADTGRVIEDVAEASRRNVVATSEEVEKLFAAEKVLGIGAEQLANSFLDVGIGIEKVGESLDESVNYIRSVGGNASQVMKDVRQNMEQMNRYNFEGGVVGLTKMAAQASMLRFDMNQTFQLADDVLNPEKAVTTAAAFQRLGVAVGTLGDPFALMNASINDPGALQDSLVDVAKQFTYFDEKTKTFKINPQGVLTFKELQKETGVSATEMSKLGLAAAELDQRLTAVNSAGLTIVNEEDKQYLANIAKMEEGTYKVTLEDGTKKELSELTQPEFDKLIKEQKEGPKTVEDIGRSQLKTTDVIMNDLKAIKQKVVGGVVTAPQATQYTEGARRTVSAFTGAAADSFDTSDVRRETQTAIGDLETLVKDLGSGNKNSVDAIADYLERAGTQLTNLDTKVKNSLEETSRKVQENLGDKTAVERYTKDLLGTLQVELDKGTDVKNQPISSLVTGQQTPIGNQNLSTSVSNTATAQRSKMDIGGTLNHNIVIKFENPPPNMTQAQLDMIAQSLSKTLNDPQYLASMQNNNKQFNPFGNNSPAYYKP